MQLCKLTRSSYSSVLPLGKCFCEAFFWLRWPIEAENFVVGGGLLRLKTMLLCPIEAEYYVAAALLRLKAMLHICVVFASKN